MPIRRLRRRLDRLRVSLGIRPKVRPPLSDEDRTPVAGEGSVRDPGHVPESMRAPCGRPPPGERPIPEGFEARDAPASSSGLESPRPERGSEE